MPVSLEEAGEPSVPSKPRELTASAVFDLLSNKRRRCVMHFLLEQPETTVRELSRHVAAWENDIELSEVSAKQRKRVYTGLHQTHLPRLDEHGVLEYDCSRGDIRAADRLRFFEAYLDTGHGNERNWHHFYLGFGVAVIVYGIGALVGVPVIAALPPVVSTLLVGTLLTTIAVAHAGEFRDDDQPTYADLQPTRAADEAPAD